VEDRPIVVKRVKKGGGGHHGGAWKVAFADFAMALMAFFLVMWVTQQASPEQRRSIQQYFQDPVGFEDGGMPEPIDLGEGAQVSEGPGETAPEELRIADDDVRDLADTMERRETQQLMQELDEKMSESETLQEFKDQLLIDITDEGLRIQIVDRSQRPMFDSGSADMKYYSEDILFELAEPLSGVRNKLSITGHTDSTPFVGRPGYTNWELSADRANTARRTLVAAGVDEQQIGRVVGLGDSVLFNQDDPEAPVNRRISIIVLTEAAREAMEERESTDVADDEMRQSLGEDDWMERVEEQQVDEGEVSW